MKKERSIICNAQDVRALLAGTKTQTRRIVKARSDRDMGPRCVLRPHELAGEVNGGNYHNSPYGQPGDRLWVRETFIQGWPLVDGVADQFDEDGAEKPITTWYRATSPGLTWSDEDGGRHEPPKWRPSVHMPRAASRITLEITGIRVERLQSISNADAIAEGIERQHDGIGWKRGPISGDIPNTATRTASPRLAYQSLWESVNGTDSWGLNPLVMVIEFKRVEVAAA